MGENRNAALRLPNKVGQFRALSNFIDCHLKFQNQPAVPAHSLVLSKNSRWFKRYFEENPFTEREVEVKIPVNPGNILKEVLDFIYTGKMKLNPVKIVDFYYCVYFYEMDTLIFIAKQQLSKSLNIKTVLHYASSFKGYHLDDPSPVLAPIIAEEILKNIKNENFTYNLKDIYTASSCSLISEALKNEILADIPAIQKVEMIDAFVGDSEVEDIKDQEALASVTDWTAPDAVNIFVRNRCDWLPASISRNLFSRAIDVRREDAALFRASASSTPELIGPWYPLAWLKAIADANAEVDSEGPTLEAIEFFSTLGVLREPLDPRKFTLMEADTSKPLSSLFGPSELFAGRHPFASVVNGGLPYFALDFGPHAGVRTLRLVVSTEVMSALGEAKMTPSSLTVRGFVEGSDDDIYTRKLPYKKLPEEDGARVMPLDCAVPVRKLFVGLRKDSGLGFNVLRISKIKVFCKFLPA